jgi:hypothetical protein
LFVGPLAREEEAKPSVERADVLEAGDQPDGRIAGPGLDGRDLQLGARADRLSPILFVEEIVHR